MALPRIRTLKEALEEFKAADPKTAITLSYLRRVAPRIPGTIKCGNRILLNMDEVEKYLSDPDRAEKDRVYEYEQARKAAGIRPVSM